MTIPKFGKHMERTLLNSWRKNKLAQPFRRAVGQYLFKQKNVTVYLVDPAILLEGMCPAEFQAWGQRSVSRDACCCPVGNRTLASVQPFPPQECSYVKDKTPCRGIFCSRLSGYLLTYKRSLVTQAETRQGAGLLSRTSSYLEKN